MRREFKGLALNDHVTFRKPLISDDNWKKKKLKSNREHKSCFSGAIEKGHVV